jgi:hypothetical protein
MRNFERKLNLSSNSHFTLGSSKPTRSLERFGKSQYLSSCSIYTSSSYLTGHTLHLHYKHKFVKDIQGNVHSLY